ncbi:MAG: methylglyoxal synthase [Pseudomonadota bacterium]
MKTIALVAHDGMKFSMIEWIGFNLETLRHYRLVSTRTTGETIKRSFSLEVQTVESGPLGGDARIATMILDGKVDMLIFFKDHLKAQPHMVDVDMLTRQADIHDIPAAYNRSSANFLISSPLLQESLLGAA